MRRKKRDFGRLKLVAIFIFVAVLLPKFINARSTDGLGEFAEGETGIKLCAVINDGYETTLRFSVSSDQGFESDVIVANNTCKTIETTAANYTIREYVPQEYALDSVYGGTVNADNTAFVTTSAGQYTVVYENSYEQKPYLHSFGYTSTNTEASAVAVIFNANGGEGSMNAQSFGLNEQQALTTNVFTRSHHAFAGWNTAADGTGTPYTDEQVVAFATGGELNLYAQWVETRLLYEEVTTVQTNNGVDTGIAFNISPNATSTEDKEGLNIREGTEDDEYPIYYYRGDVSNNNVIWGGYCWKIIRTTETGGTKMIYYGTPTDVDGQQTCSTEGYGIEYNNQRTFPYSNNPYDFTSLGWMYGKLDAEMPAKTDVTLENTDIVTVASSIASYENGIYTLSGIETGAWSDIRLLANENHKYICLDGTASNCTKLGFIYSAGTSYSSKYTYYDITGYENVDDFTSKTVFANENDSNAKIIVDGWFEENLLDVESDLEDTIFCNDRSMSSFREDGVYSDKSDAYTRNYVNANPLAPTLDCAREDDQFTKAGSGNGNEKLTHSVGLITMDELTLAGVINSGYNSNNSFLRSSEMYYTMTPSFSYVGYVFRVYNGTASEQFPGDNRSLRPVISLKNSTPIKETGDGTATNPYIVK